MKNKLFALIMSTVLLFSSFGNGNIVCAQELSTMDGEDISVVAMEKDMYGTGVITEMTNGFELSDAERAAKNSLAQMEYLNELDELIPGRDYVEQEVILLADTEEFARQTAAAYGGILKDFSFGVATISLPDNISVKRAVRAAADPSNTLPVVEPNFKIYLDPIEEKGKINVLQDGVASNPEKIMPKSAWSDWFQDTPWTEGLLANPDPYLTSPSDEDYQWFHDSINSYQAWYNVLTLKTRGVAREYSPVVAVIDTGVKADHPDFNGNVTTIDIGRGTTPTKTHGTHVAGLIGAVLNNGTGGAGTGGLIGTLSGDAELKILGIKIFDDDGSATLEDEIKGINAAVSNGADIINISLGGYVRTVSEENAIRSAIFQGVTVVAAMGNSGTNIMEYPAALPLTGLIAVSATDHNGAAASFSSYGKWADVAAPGTDIWSTSFNDTKNAYEGKQGTSMSTPIVAGACALYMYTYGPQVPSTMEAVIKKSVSKCASKQMGTGIIDLSKLITVSSISTKSMNSDVPAIEIYDKNDNLVTELAESEPVGYYLQFSTTDGADADRVIYTTDGSTPMTQDGVVIQGDICETGGKIWIDSFATGKIETVKAAFLSDDNKVGEIAEYTILTPMKSKTNMEILEESDEVSETMPVAASVSLDKSVLALGYRTGCPETENIQAVVSDKNKEIISWDQILKAGYSWTSSNSKVAVVKEEKDGKAVIQSTGSGICVITFRLLDGSGVKATCAVSVSQKAENILVAGKNSVLPGTSTVFKAQVLPENTENKSVRWETVGDVPEGVYLDPHTGKLTVDASVSQEKTVQIAARTTDGSEVLSETKVIYLHPMANNVMITGGIGVDLTFNKKSVLTNMVIYTTDLPETEDTEECYGYLVASTEGDVNPNQLEWTSGNTKVAKVYKTSGNICMLAAVGPGTTTITCKATDGTKKKTTMKVKVLIPAAGIDINNNDSLHYAGVGKTIKNTATLRTTYGKPSVKKIQWDYVILKNGTLDEALTREAWRTKAVTISSSGNLKINAKKWSNSNALNLPTNGTCQVVVVASTTDGTGYSDTVYYNVQAPVTRVHYYGAYQASDGSVVISVFTDQYLEDFKVTNSNPAVGAYYYGTSSTLYTYEYKNKEYTGYESIFVIPNPSSGAKNKVTITADDGSKKKTSQTFKF